MLDALNGGADHVDPSVVRALKSLADTGDEDRAELLKGLSEVKEELKSMKARMTTVAIGAGTTIGIAAILAALRVS